MIYGRKSNVLWKIGFKNTRHARSMGLWFQTLSQKVGDKRNYQGSWPNQKRKCPGSWHFQGQIVNNSRAL